MMVFMGILQRIFCIPVHSVGVCEYKSSFFCRKQLIREGLWHLGGAQSGGGETPVERSGFF